MPRILTIDSRLQAAGILKELPSNSMILGGILVDKQTLRPRFPTSGDETNAAVRDWYNNSASGSNTAPFQIYTSRTNFNTPVMSCFYYLSGYWRCNNVATDSTNNRTFYLVHGNAVGAGANRSVNTSANPSQLVDQTLNSTGQYGGWGYVRDFNRSSSGGVSPGGGGYATCMSDWAVHAYDNVSESYLWTNRYSWGGYYSAPSDLGNNGSWNGVTQVVGIARIDGSGNRYYWRIRSNWNDMSGTSFGNGSSGLTQSFYGQNLVSGLSRDYNNTLPPMLVETATAASNAYGTSYGPSNTTVYRQFIVATNSYIYYMEFTLNNGTNAGMHYPSTSNIQFLKRVTYSGTETTIASYPAWMYGAKLPTQIFNETGTTASFIYHVWGQWTGSAHAVTLYRCDIDKTLNTESVTALSLDSGSNTAFTRMYNLFGIQTTSVPVGVYNNQFWRAYSMVRTWLVTGATGTVYLMVSFEHSALTFSTVFGGQTSPANNSTSGVSIQSTYFNTTTHTNDNGSGFLRRDAFRVWSFTLDGTYSTLTYQAETDFSNLMPRWFVPLDSGGLVQYMSHASDGIYDKIVRFDEVSKKWAVVNTMPVRCDHVALDSLNRIWISANQSPSSTPDTLYLESFYIPTAINISAYANSYAYSGTPINSNISVSTTNFAGNLVAANIGVALSGNITFDDGSIYRVITTSSSAAVTSNIIINGSYTSKFSANIVNLL